MRIIGTLHDEAQARLFSAFLKAKGIEHELDVHSNKDWGSEQYGNAAIKVWIINEDNLEDATRWLQEFNEDPTNPLFLPKVDILTPASPLGNSDKIIPFEEFSREAPPRKASTAPLKRPKEEGKLTYYILGLCILLFIFSEATQPAVAYSKINKALYTPLSMSPVNQALMYDYPAAFEIINKIETLYGVTALEDLNTLPIQGKFLLEQYTRTPYWQGIYDQLIVHIKDMNAPWNFSAPMFEKIKEGQVWRLFTPALLHYDLLHIFFNMTWLIVLGRQIENRIKGTRYILFILITAIISNTAQYLMSGSNFIGFSGVVCAMIAFIWARQQHAAWEGYQLQRSSLIFVGVFLISIVLLQFISFVAELSGAGSFTPGIANTAHLVGALTGYLLGRFPIFPWKA